MPQLDFFSIANQFTWGIIYFAIFYFIVNSFVVPTIFASIFAREFVIKNSGSDNFENIFYSFTAFYIFNAFLSDLLSTNTEIFSEISTLNFNSFVVTSQLIVSELNALDYQLFEDYDNN